MTDRGPERGGADRGSQVEMVIPAERLPAGFAQRIGGSVDSPATPQPAATAVLMRDGISGIEVLLMKRHRASGFVPGAYVFAGGRVDEADGSDRLVAMLSEDVPSNPPIEYWLAAVREVFEEAGVLLARAADGKETGLSRSVMAELREALMTEHGSLADVLSRLSVQPDFASMAYAAHWITPLAEARRYDTRFFYAAMPSDHEATADAREMSDAIWLSPAEALERFRAGRLPMVFPTVKTLEDLVELKSVDAALATARASEIKPILPTLVRVGDGVGIVIDAVNDRATDKGRDK